MKIEEVDIRIKQATHIPMLIKVFELTKGDVLELGTGYFSTTILRWLCQMAKRRLISYETSNFWYEKAIKNLAYFVILLFFLLIQADLQFPDGG